MSTRKIIIVTNSAKEGVGEQVERLRPWFARQAEVVAVVEASDAAPDGAAEADLCVVFGGDGTLLAAARMLSATGTALLGVNMGKLGFLAEYDVEHMKKHFEAILEGEIAPVERIMLDVQIVACDRHAMNCPAANDVAISSGSPFRMIDINVTQDGRQIARYLGDGLVVATPTGTTGYNLSAGGPILDPTLDAVTITPVAPHTLSMRSIVVRTDLPIFLTAESVNPGSAVIVDGQVTGGLCDGDVVEIRKAPRGLRLVPHPGHTFFDTLTRKLQWGSSPHHPSNPAP